MPKITLNAPYSITHGRLTQPLTDSEGRLVWAFMCRPGLTTPQMAEVIWPNEWDWPLTFEKCIQVKLCQLRQKLAPFGWSISLGSRGASRGDMAKRYLKRVDNGG